MPSARFKSLDELVAAVGPEPCSVLIGPLPHEPDPVERMLRRHRARSMTAHGMLHGVNGASARALLAKAKADREFLSLPADARARAWRCPECPGDA